MTDHRSRYLLPSLIPFALLAGPARAADETAQLLPEVVVSASRIPVAADAVGSAATVITSEQLEQRQTMLVSEILRTVPGVSVSRSGPRGSITQLRIRGTEARHVLVVIDGVEANDIPGGSEFNWAHLLARDVERIEVLRGNQSALWGSDAIGGVVNIVTKSGRKGTQISAYGEAGSFASKAGGAALRGGGDTFDYAFSADGLRTNGTNVSSGGSEQDGYRNFTTNFKGGWRPTENLEFGGTLRGVRATNEYDDVPFTSAVPVDSDDTTERRETYARVFGKLTSLGGAWDNRISAGVTDTHNMNRTNGILGSENAGTRTKLDYLSTYRLNTPSFALARHTFTFLAERENEDFSQRGFSNQDHEWTNHAVGGEYRLDLFDSLFLSGALRRDFNDMFQDRTTGRVTAAYLVAPTDSRLHASYGTGAKNPSFISLYGFFNNYVGNPNLKPETSHGWDVGIEQSFWNQRATIDVTYFEQTIGDRIGSITTGGVSSPINLDGDSKSRGIEISGRITPVTNLDLRGSYTYLRAKDPAGLEQVRRAPHSGSLSVNYRFLEDRANVNLAWDFNGQTYDNSFPPPTYATTRVLLTNYRLVNLGGSYKVLDNIELYARVENLLDEKYEEIFGYRASGIGVYGGLRWAFNR